MCFTQARMRTHTHTHTHTHILFLSVSPSLLKCTHLFLHFIWQLCSVGGDCTLRIWDISDGTLIKTVSLSEKPLAIWAHEQHVFWAACTPSSSKLLTCMLNLYEIFTSIFLEADISFTETKDANVAKSTLFSLNLKPWATNGPVLDSTAMCTAKGVATWCIGSVCLTHTFISYKPLPSPFSPPFVSLYILSSFFHFYILYLLNFVIGPCRW